MARISGTDLPKNKRLEVSLTYLYGIGAKSARDLVKMMGFEPGKRTHELTDTDVARLRDLIEKNFKVEGDLRREVSMSIKKADGFGLLSWFSSSQRSSGAGTVHKTKCQNP